MEVHLAEAQVVQQGRFIIQLENEMILMWKKIFLTVIIIVLVLK